MTFGELLAAVSNSSEQKPLSTTEAAKEEIRIGLLGEELRLAKDNRTLRKTIALCVGVALAIEIIFLFLLVLAQGLGYFPFSKCPFVLEKWTFSIFTSAVLLQTFGLAHLIVRNLFPNHKKTQP